MPWQVFVHSDHPIVEASYRGMVSPAELTQAIGETIRLAMAHQTHLLVADCSQLKGGHSVVDLFMALEDVNSQRVPIAFREAVLLPALPAQLDTFKFWETTAANHGMVVELFNDRQKAIDWLLAGHS